MLLVAALSLTACGGGTSPEDVCKKMGELAAKESAEAKAEYDAFSKMCPEMLAKAKEQLGEDKFNENAKCVMKASTFSEAKACK
jgi:hypothetical protein